LLLLLLLLFRTMSILNFSPASRSSSGIP
jgi:hypothetical protein